MDSSSATIRALELLASKICHDLISPIGAIANGVELLEEGGADGAGEIAALLSYSAGQASAKLRAYRIVYGAGGSDSGLKPEEIHKTLAALLDGDKKITQNWDPHGSLNPQDRPAGYCKILACVFLLATECLPKGGAVSAQGDAAHFTVTAAGPDAHLRDTVERALLLQAAIDAVDPRGVHAYISGLTARHYGYDIGLSHKDGGRITFTVRKTSA